MGYPVVYFDIAGPDDATLKAFYAAVFGWDSGPAGQLTIDVVSPIDAAIRKDPAEKRIYVGVPDISTILKEVERLGGTIDAPRFEVPGVVVLGLFKDPAGNPMGLVEMEGSSVRIP